MKHVFMASGVPRQNPREEAIRQAGTAFMVLADQLGPILGTEAVLNGLVTAFVQVTAANKDRAPGFVDASKETLRTGITLLDTPDLLSGAAGSA